MMAEGQMLSGAMLNDSQLMTETVISRRINEVCKYGEAWRSDGADGPQYWLLASYIKSPGSVSDYKG